MQLSVKKSPLSESHRFVRKLITLLLLLGLTSSAFVGGIVFHRQGLLWKTKHLPKQLMAKATAPPIPVIHLDVKFKHWQTLLAKRQQAINVGFLIAEEDDEVPAQLRVNDQTLRARIRLKGDLVDHFQNARKLSLRVKLRGKDQFMGMRVFSLQHPTARQFDGGWLIYEHLRQEDLLAVRYFYVRLVINGEDHGIFALEEHFSKELLESQNRREGVILRFDEAALFNYLVNHGEESNPNFEKLHLWPAAEAHPVREFRSATVNRSPELASQRDSAIQLLTLFKQGKLPASQVFKVQETARFLAVNELWHNWHSLYWTNIRFYYDPIVGRIEPVGYDARVERSSIDLTNVKNFTVLLASESPTLDFVAKMLEDPALAQAYVHQLDRMTSTQYLAQLKQKLQKPWERIMRIMAQEWPDFHEIGLTVPWLKGEWIRSTLASPDITYGHASIVPGPESTGSNQLNSVHAVLQMANPMALPVELLSVGIGDGSKSYIWENPQILPPRYRAAGPRAVDMIANRVRWTAIPIVLPASCVLSRSITVSCRILGVEQTQEVTVPLFHHELPVTGPRPAPPTLRKALQRHPFLVKTQDTRKLKVKPGSWIVEGDLILPEGVSLEITGDCTLMFEDGAVVLLNGGQLNCQGTASKPIRFLPVDHAWGGILVLDAPESKWEYVTVSATTGIHRPGWTVTGGVCFYQSPVQLTRCRFDSSFAEDALNVVRGQLTARHVVFKNAASDAVDCDFVSASLTDCWFEQIEGDGIDLSGSLAYLNQIHLSQVTDKAISVGEASELHGENLHIDDVNMAIVSKDSSRVKCQNVDIRNANYAIAVYTKKPEYGPATMTIENAHLTNVIHEALVQTGSDAQLNNRSMPKTDVDVEAIYAGPDKTAMLEVLQ